MANSTRILIVGSLNTDMIVRTARVPTAGETLATKSFSTGCGGKGANQAIAVARLSRNKNDVSSQAVVVSMAGAVGDDQFGRDATQSLVQNGIDVSQVVVREGVRTGNAIVIIDDESGENRILLSLNANGSVKPEDFAIFGEVLPDLIILQLEIPVATVLALLRAASQRKVEVLLNPAPAQRLPVEAYQAVTYLVVNESEAAIVTGNEGKTINWLQDSPERQSLLELGPKHIIVTLGSEGGFYAAISDGKVETYQWKSLDVSVRDTAAAGDTFVGAFAVAVASNKDRSFETLKQAITWANEAASITVQRDGAAAAIPWMDELRPQKTVST